jgi:hypothetical protein
MVEVQDTRKTARNKLGDNAALKRETQNDLEIEGKKIMKQGVRRTMERQCIQGDKKT